MNKTVIAIIGVILVLLVVFGIAAEWQGQPKSNPIQEPNEDSKMTLKVFFGNRESNPQLECDQVFPVTRELSKTEGVGRAALNELLAGPTEEEKALGYFTSLNSGVVLKSIKIEDGVAYADFNEKLDEGIGGACRVTAIRSQITETLKQFPTVQSVVISENGESDLILQP